MHRALVLAAAVAVSGCAANATQTWRTAPDPAAPVWKITGRQGPLGKTVISINGQPAIEGKVSFLTGAGTLAGEYEGKALMVSCKRGRSEVRTQCAMTVDGRKATTLYFRMD